MIIDYNCVTQVGFREDFTKLVSEVLKQLLHWNDHSLTPILSSAPIVH